MMVSWTLTENPMAALVFVTFLATALLFQIPLDALAQWQPRPIAFAITAVLVGGSTLLLSKVASRVRLSNPHLPIAFAWTVLAVMAVHFAMTVGQLLGLQPSNDNVWHIAAFFGLVFVWWLLVPGVLNVVFGRAAVDALWTYVKEHYSTFRKV